MNQLDRVAQSRLRRNIAITRNLKTGVGVHDLGWPMTLPLQFDMTVTYLNFDFVAVKRLHAYVGPRLRFEIPCFRFELKPAGFILREKLPMGEANAQQVRIIGRGRLEYYKRIFMYTQVDVALQIEFGRT